MTPEERLSAFESARSRREALRAVGGEDISEGLFLRVAALSGQDPAACIRLSRRTDWVESGNRAFLLRAKAVGARAAGRWQDAADLFFAAAEHCRGIDRWVFSLGAIDSLARAGKTADAVDYGRRAIGGLRARPELAARARLNVANALVWQDRNREARAEYRQALLDLPAESRAEHAIAHLGISTASLFTWDPQDARASAEIAAGIFSDLGMDYHAALARTNIAQADLQLGRADDAVREFLALEPELADSPPDAARLQEFLGDCYLRLNLGAEAESAYRTAMKKGALTEMPLNQANCRYGLARLIEWSNPTEAQRLYRLAARGYGAVGNRPWELAAAGRGTPALARAVGELQALGARYLSEDLALWGAEQGRLLIPRRPKSPPLEWRHALLVARSRPSRANYRRVFELIERDRQAVRTPSAALRFFDDRGTAVNEYLELLIREGAIPEAIDVITRARSAALIDEIMASQGQQLSADALARLEDLRTQYSAEQSPGARLRTDARTLTPRAWTEATWSQALPAAAKRVRPSGTAADVWLDTGSRLYRLQHEVADLAPCAPAELSRKLDWLEFFLFEPMLDPDADWNCPHDAIEELRGLLGSPASTTCPDGILWRAPWPLLSENEVTLVLNPADQFDGFTLPENPRIAIWAAFSDDLPSIEAEIAAIKQSFPQAEVFTNRESIRTTYGQSFDLIHIAGHARINQQSPALSYIDFVDGPLFATEIAKSGLRTGVALVAACRSGLAHAHQRFEPEGIVRAFLACGAAAAVGSLWPLDDRFTSHFMGTLYPLLAYGKTLSEAMSVARHEGRRHFPHPYYWGSLATFGGYRNP